MLHFPAVSCQPFLPFRSILLITVYFPQALNQRDYFEQRVATRQPSRNCSLLGMHSEEYVHLLGKARSCNERVCENKTEDRDVIQRMRKPVCTVYIM